MRKQILNLALLGIVAASTTVAHAQGKKMDPFDYHVASITVLLDKRVQTELKVTDAQRTAMNRHADKYKAGMQAYASELRSKGTDPDSLKGPDARIRALMEDMKKGVMGELSVWQLQRLREISLQALGLVAILDPQVAKKVGVSDAQLKKLRDTYTNGSEEASKLLQKELTPIRNQYSNVKPKDDADKKRLEAEAKQKLEAAEKRLNPQVEKVRADTRAKMLAILSKAQQNKLTALQGKAFNPA